MSVAVVSYSATGFYYYNQHTHHIHTHALLFLEQWCNAHNVRENTAGRDQVARAAALDDQRLLVDGRFQLHNVVRARQTNFFFKKKGETLSEQQNMHASTEITHRPMALSLGTACKPTLQPSAVTCATYRSTAPCGTCGRTKKRERKERKKKRKKRKRKKRKKRGQSPR